MRRALIAVIATAAAAAAAIAPAAASADEVHGFDNSTQIDIPAQGQASPYPSVIHVDGLRGPVTDVQVGLIGVTHERPEDLDILLVAPDGTGVVLMSDTCGSDPISNYTLVVKSSGNLPQMGQSCGGIFFSATNVPAEPDSWPNSNAPFQTPFSGLHRKAMNGDWKLYVVDDTQGASGKIARGWTLQITTGPVDNFLPGNGTSGPAEHYPTTKTVERPVDQVISDLNVGIFGLAHDKLPDVNLLLVGPQGQNVMLMRGACAGTIDASPFLDFDQQAPAPLLQDSHANGCSGRVTPTDYGPAGSLPAPAPSAPYGSSLAAFDGTSPSGEWKLYAADGAAGGDGYIARPFSLEISTRPKAAVAFTRDALAIGEGTTQEVTVSRTASGNLGAADVTLTTSDGSATAGADFTPIARTLHFDRGESQKTVTLDAVDDRAAELAETYTVTLSDASGDAQLGAPSQLDVTIPASAGKQDPGPHPVPATPKCDGKPATIVGTSGRDVLSGTRHADVIVGLAGNDTIRAAAGNDTVCGGAGRDTCSGGRGRNRVSCERKTGR